MPLGTGPALAPSVATAPAFAQAPIGADEFADTLSCLGPFEARPRLAVAVSGGRDSMALALLASEWACARGGEAVAVTVDHGLRAESAREALQVADWLAGRDIPHHRLTWTDTPGPDDLGMGASEAAARSARYGLLEAFCRDQGILHLLVGHHRDDQAETQAMRRARASGVIGRAGMPAVRELRDARLLRPLLGFPRVRMAATLAARGQAWLDDPSNTDPRFARARMRLDGDPLPMADMTAAAARQELECAVAGLAARAVALHPAGFALLDPALLGEASAAIRTRLVSNLLTCIGGSVYPPRGARLARLCDQIMGGRVGGGMTLGGCTIRPVPGGRIRFVRELAGISPPRILGASEARIAWDGRFRIAEARAGLLLGAVGQLLDRGAREAEDSSSDAVLPHAVRMALPAVCSGDRFYVCRLEEGSFAGSEAPKARFSPNFPVSGAIFATL